MTSRRWSLGLRSAAAGMAVFLATFGAAAAVTLPGSASPVPLLQDGSTTTLKPRPSSISVMVVGDSMTQGHEGDWTWRYRLWEWFDERGVDVNFVGPWEGTTPADEASPPVPPPLRNAPPHSGPDQKTTGGYAVGVDPAFNSHHFSAWGRQLGQANRLIRRMVTEYEPDYLLVMLGFNDVGWFISDAEGTFESMKIFISEARAAKPDIKMALGNIPQRSFIGGREDLPIKTKLYNRMLAAAIPEWSTATSQIELVKMREHYDCDIGGCPVAYDGLHPNVLGEYQIAQAFSHTLVNNFSIGKSELAIPASLSVRPISVPTNFQAVSSPTGITVTWDAVYGATSYDLKYRFVGTNNWYIYALTSNRYDTGWVLDGWEYEYMIRTRYGDQKTEWSETSSAVCHPQTPRAPTGIVTRATATGLNVSWPSLGHDIVEYALLIHDRDTPGAMVNTIGIEPTSLSVHVDSLTPGIHYAIALQAWNQHGGGFPGAGQSVTVGAGTPPPPTNLRITSLDDTTIKMDWCGSPDAAGYLFWSRNINVKDSELVVEDFSTTETTRSRGFLFSGVWNYEFCISAFNGELESSLSNCVVPLPPGEVAGSSVDGVQCYSGSNIAVENGWTIPPPPYTVGTGQGSYDDSLCNFRCSLDSRPQACACEVEDPQGLVLPDTTPPSYPLLQDQSSPWALGGFLIERVE